MSSPAQIAANRANSQLSTGPVTPEGKAVSSHNAVKTGLTGQTMLIPTDKVEAYTAHMARVAAQFDPKTDEERTLVQAIVDADWRLFSIPGFESGIRALGRRNLAGLYPEIVDQATRASYINAEVQLAYKKDLANLALQETRLLRRRKKDAEKLEELQAAREKAEKSAKDMSAAAKLYEGAKQRGNTFVPRLFGFEFSLKELEDYIHCGEFKRNMTGTSESMSKEQYAEAHNRFVTKAA